MDKKRITPNELSTFVDRELYNRGWARRDRETVQHVFKADTDLDHGDRATITHGLTPGINEDEMTARIQELRDPNSGLSRVLKYPLPAHKVDELEIVLRQAYEEHKEKRSWF